jgi:hypothetical protein
LARSRLHEEAAAGYNIEATRSRSRPFRRNQAMALTRKEREKVANAEAIQKAFTEIVNGILRVAMISGKPEREAAARWLQALLNSEDGAFKVGGVEGSRTGAPPDGRVISVVITLVVPPAEERKQTDPQQ